MVAAQRISSATLNLNIISPFYKSRQLLIFPTELILKDDNPSYLNDEASIWLLSKLNSDLIIT